MAMETDTIPNLLGDQRDQAPEELQNYFIDFEDYWERKLWHELTDKLIEYFEHPESAKQRIPLFETFIKSFANKINQLKLVTLGLSAAPQIKGRRSSIMLQCYAFVDRYRRR
jgi:26S proteasome regulatory subunit N9